ncbi:MAG: MgtC/SapB family protein [Sedimentisphaerales bacterium]|jgi:putative Mg2+ transporter-C (MgtC) family protein
MDWNHDIIPALLAIGCGAIIGIERQFKHKPAGLRTNIMICLGAAVFTLISERMALGSQDSVTRIASGIVTGVGFLGAGAVIQDRGGIHGLTTAATIWLVASIGMACGARLYYLAVITTFLALVVLVGLGRVDKYLNRNDEQNKSH